MQDNVFEVINPLSDNCLILTCEHASAKVPPQYNDLGLPQNELNRHIARDKGVAEITVKLAEKLGCFAILGRYSRLLIDLNRAPNEAELIVAKSDGTLIPANQNLSFEEKESRLKKYYNPYYAQINQQIQHLENLGKKPIVFSVHSFTPQLQGGAFRPWQAGILSHTPQKLADYLLDYLKQHTSKVVDANVPYDLRAYNTGAAVFCGERNGYDYALIEIRDSEFDNLLAGTAEWADILYSALAEYLA